MYEFNAYWDAKKKIVQRYKDVPSPITYKDPPMKSGVYFIWIGDFVVYVGQSQNLFNRILSHKKYGHMKSGNCCVSWLRYDVTELDFAEAFYIAICRPSLNFGANSRAIVRT